VVSAKWVEERQQLEFGNGRICIFTKIYLFIFPFVFCQVIGFFVLFFCCFVGTGYVRLILMCLSLNEIKTQIEGTPRNPHRSEVILRAIEFKMCITTSQCWSSGTRRMVEMLAGCRLRKEPSALINANPPNNLMMYRLPRSYLRANSARGKYAEIKTSFFLFLLR
jgi:hypothetical protein